MKNLYLKKYTYFLGAAIIAIFSIISIVYAQQKKDVAESSCPLAGKMTDKGKSHEDCPLMKKSMAQSSGKTHSHDSKDHYAMVMENGEREMGFSQTATTHHFLLMKDGGAIQVEANNSSDTSNRDKIRVHLQEIAQQFAKGDFKTPFAVHEKTPDGVPSMDDLKQQITYKYEETKKGGRVRISTGNTKALTAIHEFIKFQIEEHKTSDPLTLEK